MSTHDDPTAGADHARYKGLVPDSVSYGSNAGSIDFFSLVV